MSRQGGAKLKYKEKMPPRRKFADMVLPRVEGSAPSHAKITKTDNEAGEATVKLSPTPAPLPVVKLKVKPKVKPKKEQKAKSAQPLSKKPSIKDADTVLTQPAPKRVRDQQALTKKKSQSKVSNSVLMFALFAIVVATGVVMTPTIRTTFMSGEAAPAAKLDRDSLEQFVTFHRHQVGGKLNRERLGVEIDNEMTAPPLGYDATKVPAPNMLNGLPLAGETFTPSVERPDARREPMNPDFPDARMMYNLQEQQDEAEWERRAQKQYVDEFVANAQRAGYKVRIDKYGRATIMGGGTVAPQPRLDEDGDPVPAFPGAVR